MTTVKINGTEYPADISGKLDDREWGGRASKTIRLAMTAAEAAELFVDDVPWSILEDVVNDQDEETQEEYDNSDYCVAGDITDHRDGTVSVKMGKLTDREVLQIITGGAV